MLDSPAEADGGDFGLSRIEKAHKLDVSDKTKTVKLSRGILDGSP